MVDYILNIFIVMQRFVCLAESWYWLNLLFEYQRLCTSRGLCKESCASVFWENTQPVSKKKKKRDRIQLLHIQLIKMI